MVDDHYFLGAEDVVGDDQRADGVFGGDAAGIANHVGVTDLVAEEFYQVHARVHAGEDGEFADGSGEEMGAGEMFGVEVVGF